MSDDDAVVGLVRETLSILRDAQEAYTREANRVARLHAEAKDKLEVMYRDIIKSLKENYYLVSSAALDAMMASLPEQADCQCYEYAERYKKEKDYTMSFLVLTNHLNKEHNCDAQASRPDSSPVSDSERPDWTKPCCENEQRDLGGGCTNCKAPCL